MAAETGFKIHVGKLPQGVVVRRAYAWKHLALSACPPVKCPPR
jgi:hypothetical protein